MSHQKFLALTMSLMSALLLVGCGEQQAVPAQTSTTSTPAPVVEPSTPTPIPPMVTPTLIQPTATLNPLTPTRTPITDTPQPAPQVPMGKIKGVLINSATGDSLAGETLAVALLHGADNMDEESCGIKAGASAPALEDEETGGRKTGLGLKLVTDEQGSFLFPGEDSHLIIPPGTDTFFMFLKWGDRCFVVRDNGGSPMPIYIGTQGGVDLGEILVPTQ